MTKGDDEETLVRDHADFIAELERVCPEAASGLAIAGPPPPRLSLRERVDLLKTLPTNAGLDAFLRAWYALGETAGERKRPRA